MNHLIGCQPTALKAVRLQSLVPPSPDKIYIRDLLVKNEVKLLSPQIAVPMHEPKKKIENLGKT